MSNNFVHIELNTKDVGAARRFYAKIFESWSMEEESMGPGMTYTILRDGKKGIGGMQMSLPALGTTWLPYVEVEDVNKTLAKAEKAGAKILVPFMSIGDNGSLGVFSDPTGAALGVWSMAAKSKLSKEEKKAAKKAEKEAKKAAKHAEKEAKKEAKKAAKKEKKEAEEPDESEEVEAEAAPAPAPQKVSEKRKKK